MVDQISSGIIGNDFHVYYYIIQLIYIQGYSDRLGAADTWRGRGAKSGEEGTYDNEG